MEIRSQMPVGLWLVACFLVTGCSTFDADRFPASIPMGSAQEGSATFTARSATWHQLHLVLQRSGLSFPELLCLLGGAQKKEDPCREGERPIQVKWVVYGTHDMRPVSSGWSSPAMSDPAQLYYTDAWVSRNIGGFLPAKGLTYEVRVEISGHDGTVDRTHPAVLVRVPTPNAW